MPSILFAKVHYLDDLLQVLRCYCATGRTTLLSLLNLMADLFDPKLVDQQVESRCASCSCKYTNIEFVSIAHPFNNWSRFFSCATSLLASTRLQSVRICIQGHYLCLYVFFNEFQVLTRGRIVGIHQGLLAVYGSKESVLIRANHIRPYVLKELVFVLWQLPSPIVLLLQSSLGRHSSWRYNLSISLRLFRMHNGTIIIRIW